MHDFVQRHKRIILEQLESRFLLSVGSTYNVPTNPETVVSEDPGWKFQLNPSGSPQSTSYNDSSWSAISLPYTWDGAATTNPPTGSGWYRNTITVSSSMVGSELYLEFGGAYLVTSLYIDGTEVNYSSASSTHNGGFAGFAFDVTSQLTAGNHLIAVQVNNSNNSNISPTGASGNTGDYNHEGGLYRDVSLVAVNQSAHIALIQDAPGTNTPILTPGVDFSNSVVTMGISSATINVNEVLDNQSTSAANVDITSYLVDANGIIQGQTATTAQTLNASTSFIKLSQSATVANPHLWDGRIDPYLYTLYVEVHDASSGNLLDLSEQQVGVRSYNINANSGFYLNGQPYKLVGVDVHQDSGVPGQLGLPAGWAQTGAEIQNDVNMIVALGATVVRTSHYQESQDFYNDCDAAGILVETEVGLQAAITSTSLTSAFVLNLDDQLAELVQQNYNHPSVFAFSLYNEIGSNSGDDSLVASENSFVHTLEATLTALPQVLGTTERYTVGESNQGSPTDGINADPNLVGRHYYDGWYSEAPSQLGAELDSYHASSPNPMAVTEVGAASSAYQYTTDVVIPPANTTDHFQPANTQAEIEEQQYAQIASRNYLWADIVWQMFDATSPGKNEGDTSGVNDKGLVTRDRSTLKDTYYFYEANWNNPSRTWNNTPVVYISDHSWTDRGTNSAEMTVYSNMGAPTLTDNGGSSIALVPLVINGITIPDAYTTTSSGVGNVTLTAGANLIQASVDFNGNPYTNSVTWNYHPPILAGTSYAHVQFTNSVNNLQSGYAADTGGALSGNYGWINSAGTPTANTAGTYDRTSITTAPYNQIKYRTGIQLPSTLTWEYLLPNGIYDVHVVSADSTVPAIVDNLNVNGTLLHDLNYATDFGPNNGDDEFYTTVYVTNGKLTISAGQGSWNPVLSFIDINFIASGPTVAAPAAANPSPVTGDTTALSVVGSENSSGAGLTYTWSATSVPNGVAVPAFSVNGTNAAANTIATFFGAGNYTFLVTIADSSNLSTTSSVTVNVRQTPTVITVYAPSLVVPIGTSLQFSASATDQFGNAIGSPALAWAITGSSNAIDTTGNATLGATPGSFTVTATDGGAQGMAGLVVENFAVPSGLTLDINLGSAGPVAINSNGSGITASQNGVEISFAGITGINVTDTASTDVLNFSGPSAVPFSFMNCDTSTVNVDSGVLLFGAVPGGNIYLGAMNVLGGAGAMMAATNTNTPTTLKLSALSIETTGQFDVTNNRVVINYGTGADPISSIRSWIQSGYAGGAWNGSGIISTTVQSNALYALGYADAAEPGDPAGLTPGEIEILYTLLGDANLDGKVSGTDFAILARNFGQSGSSWDQGDFNYDGNTSGSDFAFLARNFGQTAQIAVPGGPAPQQIAATLASSAASKGVFVSVGPRHRARHGR